MGRVTAMETALADMQAEADRLELEGVEDFELLGRIAFLSGKTFDWDAPRADYLDGTPREFWQQGFMAEYNQRAAA